MIDHTFEIRMSMFKRSSRYLEVELKGTSRHFSLLNVNAAGACGYDFVCDGRRLVRAYLR